MRMQLKQNRGSITLGDFLTAEFPPDRELLGKMILEKSLGMIAGPRGGGKSWTAMILAYSIAGGKETLPWGIGSGSPITYLDGEMRASGIQERFRLLHHTDPFPSSQKRAEENFHILSRDYVCDHIGSIDTEEGQHKIDSMIHPSTKLIVVDNLSAWTNGGREDSNSWAIVKNWLIMKRLQGIAVLLIHHTGKNGQQRGSSVHEDLLDYSILLSPLAGAADRDETRFGIEHTKLRDHIPELRQHKYEGAIWTDEDGLGFDFVPAGANLADHQIKIVEMAQLGISMTDIGKELEISTSTVSRFLKKWRESKPATADDAVQE